MGAKIPYRNKRERAVTVTQTRERWSVLGWGGLHVCGEGGTMSRSPTGGPRSFLEGGAVAAACEGAAVGGFADTGRSGESARPARLDPAAEAGAPSSRAEEATRRATTDPPSRHERFDEEGESRFT